MASSQGVFGHSKEFSDLVKSIGEARSKAEEDRIVLAEIDTLKRRIAEPDIPKRTMKEFIIRLLYVEMLGHDASFGYIHAVKMTHDDSISLKRTGYLAVTLFLNEDHDLIILIVNTIQKDLRSDNYLVVCAALNAVCRLINEETIPAVLPQVVELIGHSKEAVRKKAIMALHRFHQRSAASVSHLVYNFRKRLCDNDPGVMSAALCPLFDLITTDPNSYKDLAQSFVSILKQVAERKLPKTYDYHQMPAPFLQIKLLKILALLGRGDKHSSGQMYTVVGDIVRRCDQLSNIGNAVLYESVCCVASIYPNSKLLGAAADAISRFLKSDSHNLKYMGIDALGRLIKISPEVAEQHQLAVIDCLEDPDDTLKRKTFELLYKMTKSSNVEVISERMIDYMISINDTYYKTEIASRCVELAEQYAPSNQWFIQTMNTVFEHAGNLVNIKVAHNMMRLIAEGFGEDDDTADSVLKLSAVESYLRIIGEPKLPSVFLQVICWVVGEYGTADGTYSASYVTGKLCDVADAYSSDVTAYAITAVTKILAFELAAGRKVDMLPECQSLIEELKASNSTDLQQRAYELEALISLDAEVAGSVMPLDASCEDIEVDKNLTFLDSYIKQALEEGAQPYIPESERSGIPNINSFKGPGNHEASAHALRFEAYELTKAPIPTAKTSVTHISSTDFVPVPESSYNREIHQGTFLGTVAAESGSNEVRLKLEGVQKKWGRPSYSSPSSASISTSGKASNGAASHEGGNITSKAGDMTYDTKKPQIEVSQEKQKLAASLFGGIPKDERASSSGHRSTKSAGHNAAKSHVASSVATPNGAAAAAEERIPPAAPPLPDLLDLGEPEDNDITSSVDPTKQLEGLLEAPGSSTRSSDVAKDPGFFGEMATSNSSLSMDIDNNLSAIGSLDINNNGTGGGLVTTQAEQNKGPNPKDSLQKDARIRQMGVTPTSQNPNLFKDLLD